MAIKPIGEFIRQKREAKGVSQEQCAVVLGFTHRANYHKMEAGKLRWRLDDFLTIAQLLGEEPWRLLKEYSDQAPTQGQEE